MVVFLSAINREAADRICGKRLKAVLPGLLTALEQPYASCASGGW
jgi:hypothetical protein